LVALSCAAPRGAADVDAPAPASARGAFKGLLRVQPQANE